MNKRTICYPLCFSLLLLLVTLPVTSATLTIPTIQPTSCNDKEKPVHVSGSDWTNSGGNAGRNGLSSVVGPMTPDLLWSGGRSSLISWLPVTEGNQVFMVRQSGWPGDPQDSLVVAMDLSTGGELWVKEIPYQSGDWITWIAGVKNGIVFASRSGNGASVSDNLYALDAATGDTLWVSTDLIDAGPYDGVVFTTDGDPVIGSFQDIWRINADDGETMWHTSRVGSVSGSCGGALFGDAFYVADVTGGGHILVRYDVATGARLYQSPVMPGFTIQNTPMVGPDGTVFLSRVQNNSAVDYLYAFTDMGTGFVEKWHVPADYTAFAELGVGPDGSVYAIVPDGVLARLNPVDGSMVNSFAVPEYTSSHIAVDSTGKVFFSNSGFNNGRLYAFDADLTLRWDVAVPRINIGGPSLGAYGTLIVCGTGSDVRAYRNSSVPVFDVLVSGGVGQVHVAISNVGEAAAVDVAWDIRVQGGILGRINHSTQGVISSLGAGDAANVGTDQFIFGLGKVEIVVAVDDVIFAVDGLVVGPLVFVK